MMKRKKRKQPQSAEKHAEDLLDQALQDSFPASDPIQMTEPAQRDAPPNVHPPKQKEEHRHRSPRP